MQHGSTGAVKLADGARLSPQDEVKYLGCYLNRKADGRKEVSKRTMECMAISKKTGSVLETWRLLGTSETIGIQLRCAV